MTNGDTGWPIKYLLTKVIKLNNFIFYVIHKFPKDRSVSTIRIIIGLPGDQIEIADGKVVINNKLLNEDYPLEGTTKPGKFLQKKRTKIPKDSYVVMGDNRAESKDSREWDYLNAKDIESKYLFWYWNCNN